MSTALVFLVIPLYSFIIVFTLALPLSLLFTSPITSIVHTAWERSRQEELRLTLMTPWERFRHFLFWRQTLKWCLPIIGLLLWMFAVLWIMVEVNDVEDNFLIFIWNVWFIVSYLAILLGSLCSPKKYHNKLLWYKLRVLTEQIVFATVLLSSYWIIAFMFDGFSGATELLFFFFAFWMFLGSILHMTFGLRKLRLSLPLLNEPNE
jgi:hypothetical protein